MSCHFHSSPKRQNTDTFHNTVLVQQSWITCYSHFCTPLFPEMFCKPILSQSQVVTLGWPVGAGVGGSGASNLLQPGGGTGTVIPKMFRGLLDVLLQEIVAGYAVSSHSVVEQPQLVVKDFDLQVEPKLTVKSDALILQTSFRSHSGGILTLFSSSSFSLTDRASLIFS